MIIKRGEIRETWVVKVKIWNITERFLWGKLKLESWVGFVRHSGQQHWPQNMALNMTSLTSCAPLKRTSAALEKSFALCSVGAATLIKLFDSITSTMKKKKLRHEMDNFHFLSLLTILKFLTKIFSDDKWQVPTFLVCHEN